MDPDDSDDKNPAGARISRKEENAHTSTDDATGKKTPVVHIEETTTVVRWEAPLPPPALLEQYDQVVPGLASRITKQARASESHIHELEKRALTATVEYSTRGQWMGFIALLAILGISAFAIAKGAWWVAGIALSVVTGTAAVFVLGTLRKRDEKRQGE